VNELLEPLPLVSKVVNTLIVALLAYGLWMRRRPAVHMKVMGTCFAVDVVNVIVIEVGARFREGKGAVERGLESFTGDLWSLLNFHILVSLVSIVCYTVAVVTGRRLYRTGLGRSTHRKNALVFIAARLASWVTSFLV
jgi:uncharacterized membrane protein YozB (DUF420 family)